MKNADEQPLIPGTQFPVFGEVVSDGYSHDTIGRQKDCTLRDLVDPADVLRTEADPPSAKSVD